MINTHFAVLTLTKEELIDAHRAVLARWIVENALREEQGLEPVSPPMILEKMEQLIGLSPEDSHALFHQLEDELWAYSWYSYTDQWAWFRAKQDVEKEWKSRLGRTKRESVDRLVEKKYQEKFDAYIKEIDMQEPVRRQARTAKKNSS